MRKLFDSVRVEVASFIEQRDRLTMVAALGPREYIALCKVLQSMDEGAAPQVFSVFTQPFTDPVQYVSAIVDASSQRHQDLLAASVANGGEAFPAFPQRVLDPRYAPEQRLRELPVFTRALIPNPEDQLLVAAFLPHEVADYAAYGSLLGRLLAHTFPVPWCHHMRFIVRDEPANPVLCRTLPAARTQRYVPDLSDAAVERSLEAEVDDSSTPIELRLQSLMVLAGMDSSHRRTAQALEKYALLAGYHCELGNLPALALALNGMGEACAIADRPDEARLHFERALTPALDAQDLPTLTNITFNLARLHQGQRQWQLAGEYYQGLSTLARASLNAALQVICHEQHGTCLRELGQADRALEEWRAGGTLSEGIGMLDQRLSFLRRSVELLGARGRASEVRELQKQMSALREAGAQELPL